MDKDRIADIWGPRTPYAPGTAWPARVDEFLADGRTEAEVERWVRGACLLCSNGCGLEIAVADGRIVGVRGGPRIGSITAGSARKACTAGRVSRVSG